MQEALHRLRGNDGSENGPLSDLVAPCDPLEYKEALLEGHYAGFVGGMPVLRGEYTLQQHSSQAEVCPASMDSRFNYLAASSWFWLFRASRKWPLLGLTRTQSCTYLQSHMPDGEGAHLAIAMANSVCSNIRFPHADC